ncbi:MAG: hypothetical protein ISS63_00725 [Desulfobacteraceae bacterium]|nr:hypothetical protein [Desulfobacteraceae bacterium]
MERKNVTTSIQIELIKQLRHLAVDMAKPLNELFEEAIQDVLKKYEEKAEE